MDMPSLIQQAVSECILSISAEGEPTYESRRNLLLAFDHPEVTSHPEEPRYRRSLLAITCARKTLGVWESALPQDRRPHELLELLTNSFQGGVEAELLEQKNNLFIAQVQDVLFTGPELHPTAYAGFSCSAAVAQLLYDLVPEPSERGEVEVDPQDWGAEFFSSLAYCGGAVWDGIGTPEARKEFWQWYLVSAVPSVFAAAA